MTQQEATALVAVLMAHYPKDAVEAPTLEAYSTELAHLNVGLGTAAVRRLQRECRFFPSVSELWRTASVIHSEAPGSAAAFEQAVGPPPRHPLVDRARALVGDGHYWRNEPTYALRRGFDAAYEEVLATSTREFVSERTGEGRRSLPSPGRAPAPAGAARPEEDPKVPEGMKSPYSDREPPGGGYDPGAVAPAAPLSDAQRAENLRRVRDLVATVFAKSDE